MRLSFLLGSIALLACRDRVPSTDRAGDDDDAAIPPEVVSVDPPADAAGIAADASVTVTFSEPVDPGSGSVTVDAGTWAAPAWNAARDAFVLAPSAPLAALAVHTVQVAGFVDDQGDAMAAPFTSAFETALADRLPQAPRASGTDPRWEFVEIGLDCGLAMDYAPNLGATSSSSGVTAGDFDGDEFLDLATGRGSAGSTHLYRNRADGSVAFVDVTAESGTGIDDLTIMAPTFVDWDHDGRLDLLMSPYSPGPTRLFRNQGDGTFTDVNGAAGLSNQMTTGAFVRTYGTTWADYDRDGDIDVFFARFTGDPAEPRFLFQNDGAGRFTEVSLLAGLFYLDVQQSYTPNFADMDDDGYPELLVASDHGFSTYLRNTGGHFAVDTVTELTDDNGMGASVGDYDNDGDLDWFVTSIYDPDGESEQVWGIDGNRLYQNQGDGFLVDVSEAAGVREGHWGWGSCFGDLDLDGWLDIVHVNGVGTEKDVSREEYGKDPTVLFRSNGDGTFAEIAASVGIHDTSQGRGISCADLDRDGDLDLVVTTYDMRAVVYRNDLETGHFLNVRLAGPATNAEGIGARVHVDAGGLSQLRELHLGSNFGSNDPVEAVFGLGDALVVDELRVVWPDGLETVARGIAADRFVRIDHPSR